MKNKILASFVIALGLVGTVHAATLSVQNSALTGLNPTLGSASTTGDKFTNDGGTYLLFRNASSVARTVTVTLQNATVNQPGYNPITLSNPTVSLASSGLNSGLTVVGPFGQTQFNDSNGQVNYTIDGATDLSVAAIKLPKIQ